MRSLISLDCPESLFFFLNVAEKLLVHIEEVAGVEGRNESALGARDVNLPDPALHHLVVCHCHQSEVKLGQIAKKLGPLHYNPVLCRGDLQSLEVVVFINRKHFFDH